MKEIDINDLPAVNKSQLQHMNSVVDHKMSCEKEPEECLICCKGKIYLGNVWEKPKKHNCSEHKY